jgi:hypothetical protein
LYNYGNLRILAKGKGKNNVAHDKSKPSAGLGDVEANI